MNPLKGCACQPFWLTLEDAKVEYHKGMGCPFCAQAGIVEVFYEDGAGGRTYMEPNCAKCWCAMALGASVHDCVLKGSKALHLLNGVLEV